VAAIYIVMNISILGVIPWQEFGETAKSDARKYVISVFMERLYGPTAGIIATVLIMWTAFASVFSLLLGYSRVPWAASWTEIISRSFAPSIQASFPIRFAPDNGRHCGIVLLFQTA
jgi:amino acid transporter